MQKLNTKSMTESKAVGASNYLPCACSWVETQGYRISDAYFVQDPKCAIKMEKLNGHASAGTRSPLHIDMRLHWMRDSERATNAITPNDRGIFAKSLQGTLFRLFCDALLGYYKHVKPLQPAEKEYCTGARNDETTTVGIPMYRSSEEGRYKGSVRRRLTKGPLRNKLRRNVINTGLL